MSYKVQRLAVLLCGDLRTWVDTHQGIFRYCEQWSDKVDYYFATWNTTRDIWIPPQQTRDTLRAVSSYEIVKCFQGRNLIDLQVIDLAKFRETTVTYYFQAYLSKIANIAKRRYELDNDFVYDQVIELRPDLNITFADKQGQELEMSDCDNFEYKISHVHYGDDVKTPHLTDFYYRGNSLTNDILSNRYWYELDKMQFHQAHYGISTNNHWLLYSYICTRRLVDNKLMTDPGGQYTLEEHGIWPLRPPSVTDRK